MKNSHDRDPGARLLFHLELEKYDELMIITGFITLIIVLLLMFKNWSFLRRLTENIPQSCILILIGSVMGIIAHFTSVLNDLEGYITADLFFKVLLPPIILDSAYQLYCKDFLFNLDGIVTLALVGTTLNIFAIGGSLYGSYGQFNSLPLLQCFLLASIISAVDPVAVLAVFNQIGVESSLYFLIFGESLLNDGVTVVVFDTLENIAFTHIKATTYAYAVLSFIPIALGGTLIGVLYGILTALFLKKTSRDSLILQPTVMLLMAYLAFLNAQIFHWSGILALIGVGLTQKRYAAENVMEEAKTSLEVMAAILATLSETIIFLILGFSVMKINWNSIDWWLVWASITFCLLYRFIFTYILGTLLNTFRRSELSQRHMFMMSYGGLRGAVSFAMAASLTHKSIREKFMETTLFVILFTVFLQGGSVKLFVKLFGFEQGKQKNQTLTAAITDRMNDHCMAGMEYILGGGTIVHSWVERFELFERRYIEPILCRKKTPQEWMEKFKTMKEEHRSDEVEKVLVEIVNKTPPEVPEILL